MPDSEKDLEERKETEETEEIEDTEDTEKDEVEELEAQIADLNDRMLRQRAEIDNYRKRLIKEKEDAVAFANVRLIEDLLQFLDNLERVIEAAKNGGDIKALTDGVELIRDQLMSSLEKNWGLEKIDPKGCEFNPDEHEACMASVQSGLEKETVLEVLQSGYKLHSRVLRPAKVAIGKPE